MDHAHPSLQQQATYPLLRNPLRFLASGTFNSGVTTLL